MNKIEEIRCAVRTMDEDQLRELITVLEKKGFVIAKKSRLGFQRKAVRAALKHSNEAELDLGTLEIRKPEASKYRQKLGEQGRKKSTGPPEGIREVEEKGSQYFHEWVKRRLARPKYETARFKGMKIIDGEMRVVVTDGKQVPLLKIAEGDRELSMPLKVVQTGQFFNCHRHYKGEELNVVQALVQQLHQQYCDETAVVRVI